MALTSADLSFDFRQLSTKLTASVNFKIDLFDSRAFDQMIKAFAAVIEQAVLSPERRLSDFRVPMIE